MKIDREKVIFDPTDPRAVDLIGKEVWVFDHYLNGVIERDEYKGKSNYTNLPFNCASGAYRFIVPIEELTVEEYCMANNITIGDKLVFEKRPDIILTVKEIHDANVINIGSNGSTYSHDINFMKLMKKVEQKYRPFANAEEFKPYRDKWLKVKRFVDTFKVQGYTNKIIILPRGTMETYEKAYYTYDFEDGTPFGVEVKE